jgi:hypothetical protein
VRAFSLSPSIKSELPFGSLEHRRAVMGSAPFGIHAAGLVVDDGTAHLRLAWRWACVSASGGNL